MSRTKKATDHQIEVVEMEVVDRRGYSTGKKASLVDAKTGKPIQSETRRQLRPGLLYRSCKVLHLIRPRQYGYNAVTKYLVRVEYPDGACVNVDPKIIRTRVVETDSGEPE